MEMSTVLAKAKHAAQAAIENLKANGMHVKNELEEVIYDGICKVIFDETGNHPECDLDAILMINSCFHQLMVEVATNRRSRKEAAAMFDISIGTLGRHISMCKQVILWSRKKVLNTPDIVKVMSVEAIDELQARWKCTDLHVEYSLPHISYFEQVK